MPTLTQNVGDDFKQDLIWHLHGFMRIFTANVSGRGAYIEHYNGSLAYVDLTCREETLTICRKHITEVKRDNGNCMEVVKPSE